MTNLCLLTIFSFITLLICQEASFLSLDINNKLRNNIEKKNLISDIKTFFYPRNKYNIHLNDEINYDKYDPGEFNYVTSQEIFKNDNNFEKRKFESNDYGSFVPIAKPSWAGIGGVWGKRSYNQNLKHRNNLMLQKLFG